MTGLQEILRSSQLNRFGSICPALIFSVRVCNINFLESFKALHLSLSLPPLMKFSNRFFNVRCKEKEEGEGCQISYFKDFDQKVGDNCLCKIKRCINQ